MSAARESHGDRKRDEVAAAGEPILRLIELARGFEADGHLNEAKFCRAAALAAEIRATAFHPSPGPGLDAALARSGLSLPDDVTQRVWVCRRCGEQFVGSAPEQCHSCQAGRLTFLEVLPAWYLEPVDRTDLLGALAQMPARVESACAGMDEAAARLGDWPLVEVMSHLVGAQRLMIGRARRILAEADPELTAIPAGAVRESGELSLSGLLSAYIREREEAMNWLASLTADDWRRTGRHPEWGRYTLLQQVSYLARHEQSHWPDLPARDRHARPTVA